MSQVDPETEALISETVDEVYEYRREYLIQGLYVAARDLESYLHRHRDLNHHDLDAFIATAMDRQPDWVLHALETTELPDGFAQSAAHQQVDLIDFDDPEIDHEYVLYPGNDIFQECVRGYWQILCSDKGVRGATHLIRGEDNKELAKRIAGLFIGSLGTPPSWIPFIVVFVCVVVHEGLENVCADQP